LEIAPKSKEFLVWLFTDLHKDLAERADEGDRAALTPRKQPATWRSSTRCWRDLNSAMHFPTTKRCASTSPGWRGPPTRQTDTSRPRSNIERSLN
jgi:hypothetical protein